MELSLPRATRDGRAAGMLALCFLTSCSNTVLGGSSTEAGPHAEVHFSSDGASTTKAAIDGVEKGPFDLGWVVPPGSHRATVQFEAVRRECYTANDCLDRVTSGVCSTTFIANGGQTVNVEVAKAGEVTEIRARLEGSDTELATRDCEVKKADLRYRHDISERER